MRPAYLHNCFYCFILFIFFPSKILDPTRDQPLTESLKSADYDTTRLIIPGASGVTMSASLYDYVPTTKLRGMDDYIPESAHYNYYKEGAEVPIEFDVEDEIEFPKQLDVYAFERGNCDTFDYSGKGSTNVLGRPEHLKSIYGNKNIYILLL